MPEISRKTESEGKNLAVIFAFIYAVITCADIFSYMNGLYNGSLSASFIAGLAVPFATMLVYYLHLVSLGEDSRKGALIIIIPTLFCAVCGFMTNNYNAALYAMLGALSPTLASAAVFCISKKSGSTAYCCAGASFLMLVMSVLQISLSVIITAMEKDLTFSTVLFNGINGFIDEFVSIYNQALTAAAEYYAEAGIGYSAGDLEYLQSTLVSAIALSPAIICALFFFVIYLFTKLADFAATSFGVSEKRSFGRFSIPSVTNAVFTACVVIIMLSILFESSMSAFTCGILSVLLVLLPNYIILGIRRLYGKLSRVMSRVFALILLLIILFAGLMISPYLLIIIIVFFGTSEYRSDKTDSALR